MTFGKVRNIERQVVHLRHPGYDDDCNKLLTLYGVDHPDGGVHYETARIACGILAGNRWDGVLTSSADFRAEDVAAGPYFIGRDAYFHLPEWQPENPEDPEAQLKRRYPVLVRWDEWDFPHGNLPKIWHNVLPHHKRNRKLKSESEIKPETLKRCEGVLNLIKALSPSSVAQEDEIVTATPGQDASDAEIFGSADDFPPLGDITSLDDLIGSLTWWESLVRHMKAAQKASDNPIDLNEDPKSWHEREEEAGWCQLCNRSGDDVSGWRLIQKDNSRWFRKNRMWQYTEIDPRPDEEYNDNDVLSKALAGVRGMVQIDENCHGERHTCDAALARNRGQWAFVPKFEWCGQPRLVAQMLIPQYGEHEQDSDKDYWDKGIDTSRDNPLLRPDRVALEILFASFACSLFYGLGDFLKADVDRLLFIEDHNGVVEPRKIPGNICADLYLQTHLVFDDDDLWEESLISKDDGKSTYYHCDGCENSIDAGVRYKCLDHEDCNHCSNCVNSANVNGFNHSFIRLHREPQEADSQDDSDEKTTTDNAASDESEGEDVEEDELEADEIEGDGVGDGDDGSDNIESDDVESDEYRQKWSDFLESSIDPKLQTYEYLRLPPPEMGKLTIRLFTLWPGPKFTPLCGHLLAVDVREAAFDALSYCWGDPSTKTSIMIAGGSVAITQNLKSALHNLRDPHKPKVLWIDAICINQDDNIEKAHQVSKMTEIYSRAQHTLIWLGETQDESDKAIKTWRRVPEKLNIRVWQRFCKGLNLKTPMSPQKVRAAIEKIIEERTDEIHELALPRGASLSHHGDDLVETPSTSLDEQKDSIRRLVHLKDWLDANTPLFSIEGSNEEWLHEPEGLDIANGSKTEEDSRPQQEQDVLHKTPYTKAMVALLRREWFSRVWIIQEVALSKKAIVICGNERISFWRLQGALIPMVTQSDDRLQWENEPGMRSFSYIANTTIGLALHTSSPADEAELSGNLLGILQMFRRFHATNGRDKVYALLGLLSSNAIEKYIPIDYEEPLPMTYTRTSLGLILSSKSLDVLSIPMRPQGSTLDLPSWVPDWSNTGRHAKLLLTGLEISADDTPSRFKATKDSRIERDAGDLDFADSKLTLRGYEIDRVKGVCRSIQHGEKDVLEFKEKVQNAKSKFLYGGDSDPFNLLKIWVDAGKIILSLSMETHDTIAEWEQFALSEQQPYPTGEDALTVFKKTLFADMFPQGWESAETMFEKWQQLMSARKEVVAGLIRRIPEGPETTEKLGAWWRAVNDNFRHHAQLVIASTERDTYNVWEKTFFRKLGRTEKGLLALLPDGCVEGDIVVLLKGGKMPYIVREVDGGYVFLGDSYVHGIMYGDAWDEEKCHPITFVS